MKRKVKWKAVVQSIIIFIFIIIIIFFASKSIIENTELKNLTISLKTNQISLNEDDEETIQVDISNRKYINNIVWSSSDDTIAKIDQKGHLVAIKEGKTNINLNVNGSESMTTCQIIVRKKIPLESISIDIPKNDVYVGSTYNMNIKLFPINTTQKKLSISSSNENIASVDNKGILTTKKLGKCIITIASVQKDIKQSFELDVLQKPKDLVKLSFKDGQKKELGVGELYQLNPVLVPAGLEDVGLVYTSANKTIVDVSSSGVVHAIAPGETTIICTSKNGRQAKIRIVSKQNTGFLNNQILNRTGASSSNKLMIVAHPDDETLWGGAHLQESGWYVVCLTNENNAVRKREFNNALSITNTQHIILSYPDLKSPKIKDNWGYVSSAIQKDIDLLLKYKSWDKIVTHNPEGEYGHIHHKMTNKFVTDSSRNNALFGRLYYFGKFYGKTNIGLNVGVQIQAPKLEVKNQMINTFGSQKKAILKYWDQMIPYENWIKASQW